MITLNGKASLYLPRRWGNKHLVNAYEISWSKNLEDPSKNFHCCENLKSDRMFSRSSVLRPFFFAFEPDSGWFNLAVHYIIEHAACRFLQHSCINSIFITIPRFIQSLKLIKNVK